MQVIRRDPSFGYVDTWLWVPKTYINVEGTKQSLTHVMVDRYGGATKVLHLYREAPHHLLVPRAFWRAEELLFPVVDCRPRSYARVDFSSKVKLDHRIQANAQGMDELLPTGDNVQQLSFDAMNGAMGGVLQLACGKGKTPTTLHFISEQKVPALVMLDNAQLLEQWRQEAEAFLDIPGGLGIIAAGQKDWQKGLVLGTYTSVSNWVDTMPEEVRRWFGGVYWDEGHHLSAPVFSKTAAAFYGRRYCLTATPEREDGLHVIADMHVGRVLHKDLTQPLKARFIFYWTGLSLDLTDPSCDVLDKNKELHASKVFRYFGRWKPRLFRIIQDAVDAVSTGRRVLVVGNSVDEVVNLMAVWTYGSNAKLITDIPFPLPAEIGEKEDPLELSDIDGQKLEKELERQKHKCMKLANDPKTQPATNTRNSQKLIELETNWKKYEVYKKLLRLHEKRRREFIDALVEAKSTAGFMVYGVPASKRQEFVRTRMVTFAIMKYGKEGLDAPHLDTILVSSPFSNKGGLQQLMGRITGRPKPGKKKCIVVFYRDDVGPCHGMCKNLEKHLRNWPVDEGGPFDFESVNNPARTSWQKAPDLKTAFGQ